MIFSDETIQAVWEKARGMPNRNSLEWRQDQCGAWLLRDQYNNSHSDYGWSILIVVPGGGKELENLQPFHWRNSFDIATSKPQCRVKADRNDIDPGQHVDHPRNIIE
ncbi:MAG: HNH endonuclease [Gammaproteobacteria bacterium]|nr:HNH endonuclease [Gammaproteobacteria bacterium]